MFILHYADPRFLAGVSKHGFPAEHGLRLHNTGYMKTPFGERWRDSPVLQSARKSGRPYFIDRLTGGMPFQSLDGLTDIARTLKNDAHFLGFQVHEWDNCPFHDYRLIKKEFFDKDIPFTEANFAKYVGLTLRPYFEGGDYATYRDLYTPLNTMKNAKRYLEGYFSRMVELTEGQVLSVNGYGQFPHTVFRLGGKNNMAEIGNQVYQSAFQISCVRGAGREYGKPFGVYYETWGGSPFSCTCATSFSPWLPEEGQFKLFDEFGGASVQGGSSRSLQRRLVYFSWLSGSQWWADEWGAENYFFDWDQHPLTEYGNIMLAFTTIAQRVGPVTPIVPAALVLPPDTLGLDVGYVAGTRRLVFDAVEPDPCHNLVRDWAKEMLAPRPWRKGGDDYNLTPSLWAGAIDVLSADASPEVLSRYDVTMFVDENHRAKADHPKKLGVDIESAHESQSIIRQRLPFRVDGEVGCVQAHSSDRVLVGVFNNLGVMKLDGKETLDPQSARTATITGPCTDLIPLYGEQHVRQRNNNSVTVELPPGDLAVLSFARA